ncbi:hypothetical protein RchiOBHm_Chr7g0211801 [Rosa chinensis]|uniref:Survival Motor Neuron Gemin2-binding domain-containing protein n=1 Tax=Rosa chinensis TaxID=74649 RepID=A0A2P6PAK7_ROSCH|nr:uncharacterized protein LOC112180659 isoform X2 [Rosa chinensis]XP_040367968.1 uncharacterized protein LOC112180659 isoform X2 [Rosa chinensis]PRQ18948.1 hypothetical protein RchiOBHm_Chr7g0211801 [Rosa chinensis]
MGKKEGDLWDDSALINAFDNAMTTYKKMHSKKPTQGPTQEHKLVSSPEEQVIVEAGETQEAKRIQGDADDPTKDEKTTMEMGETSNLSEAKENHCLDSYVPDPYSQDAQDMQNNYSYSEGGEDYTNLLNQYYEIEEKRQKILEKLHQFGGGNYQYSGEGSGSGSGVQWGTVSSYEQNAVPASQPSDPAVVGSCCPYMCPCLMTACTAFPACPLDSTCAGITCTEACLATSNGKPLSLEDRKIVKTAFGTAERALSSMKTNITVDSSKSEEKDESEMAETTGSETDISVVLNAWYSTGFYTGKYLVEQSIAKKRQS